MGRDGRWARLCPRRPSKGGSPLGSTGSKTLVDTFGTFAERLPVVADAAATGASWAWSQAEQRGVDPIATGQRAAALGLTLAHPDNLALAERLLASRRNLVLALDALDAIDPATIGRSW